MAGRWSQVCVCECSHSAGSGVGVAVICWLEEEGLWVGRSLVMGYCEERLTHPADFGFVVRTETRWQCFVHAVCAARLCVVVISCRGVFVLWGYSFSDNGMSRRSTLWMDDFDKDPVHAILLDDNGMPIGPRAGRPGLIHSGTPTVSHGPEITTTGPLLEHYSEPNMEKWRKMGEDVSLLENRVEKW